MAKKVLSEKQLREKAVEVFEKNPTADELYAVSDGQFFTLRNRAALHAQGKRIYTIKRMEEPTTDTKAATDEDMVDELVEAILQDAATQLYEELVDKHGKEKADELLKEANGHYEVRAKRVSEAATIEEVNQLLEGESSKTVQAAGAKRKADLKTLNHGDEGKATEDGQESNDKKNN